MTRKEFNQHILPVNGKIFRLAVRMLNSRPEAEDAVQDVCLKLWNMRRKLAEYNSIEALAVTMTKNLCIDRLRSYRSRKQNANGLENVTLPTEGRHDPANMLEIDERLQQVHAIISELPEQQRLILHLRDIEQYSYDEMEDITGLKRNNIRVTLSRARKQVRDEYQKQHDYEDRKN